MAVPASGMLSGLNLYAAPIPCQYGQTVLVSGCACDGVAMPKYLTATFTGVLSALGSQTLTWNSSTSRWESTEISSLGICDIVSVFIYCESRFGYWNMLIYGRSEGLSADMTLVGCSPFSLSRLSIPTPSLWPCSGAFDVTVTGNTPIVRSGGGSHEDYSLAVYTGWMLSGLRLFAAADCNPDGGYVSGSSCYPAGLLPKYLWATVFVDGAISCDSILLTWNATLNNTWQSAVLPAGCCVKLTSGTFLRAACVSPDSVLQAVSVCTEFDTYTLASSEFNFDPIYSSTSDFSGFPAIAISCGTFGTAKTIKIVITTVPISSSYPFDPPSALTSGVRAMFRLATLASGMYSGSILSGMLSGRRLYVAERDPCCDGGPLFSGFPTSGVSSGITSGITTGGGA